MSRRSHLVFSARCSAKLGVDQRPDARCGKSWPQTFTQWHVAFFGDLPDPENWEVAF